MIERGGVERALCGRHKCARSIEDDDDESVMNMVNGNHMSSFSSDSWWLMKKEELDDLRGELVVLVLLWQGEVDE